ncbi:hypothetical protein CEXT_25071 [Caerostris extrusa]|uniref:Uncharacterized protein n=1 Tax=Caerostris extrusa TaxID=172846 RepID=A0AAV4TMI1_CAEEX|nr:hypothetical protein CEXT_25071 [Caerostris extrusa]
MAKQPQKNAQAQFYFFTSPTQLTDAGADSLGLSLLYLRARALDEAAQTGTVCSPMAVGSQKIADMGCEEQAHCMSKLQTMYQGHRKLLSCITLQGIANTSVIFILMEKKHLKY